MEYVLQKPEGEDDPDSFFFSSHDVGEEVKELPKGYEIECQRLDVYAGYLLKNPVSVEVAVVISNSGMVTSNDKVSAAVVLPYDRIKHRFSRSHIEHVRRKYAHCQFPRTKVRGL